MSTRCARGIAPRTTGSWIDLHAVRGAEPESPPARRVFGVVCGPFTWRATRRQRRSIDVAAGGRAQSAKRRSTIATRQRAGRRPPHTKAHTTLTSRTRLDRQRRGLTSHAAAQAPIRLHQVRVPRTTRRAGKRGVWCRGGIRSGTPFPISLRTTRPRTTRYISLSRHATVMISRPHGGGLMSELQKPPVDRAMTSLRSWPVAASASRRAFGMCCSWTRIDRCFVRLEGSP